LIDMLVYLLGLVSGIVASIGAGRVYRLCAQRGPSSSDRWTAASSVASRFGRMSRRFSESTWFKVAVPIASLVSSVMSRNWRGLGFRALHLRRVDAHTGGRVTVRSAIAGDTLKFALGPATRWLFGSRMRHEQERLRALQPQMKDIQRKYA